MFISPALVDSKRPNMALSEKLKRNSGIPSWERVGRGEIIKMARGGEMLPGRAGFQKKRRENGMTNRKSKIDDFRRT